MISQKKFFNLYLLIAQYEISRFAKEVGSIAKKSKIQHINDDSEYASGYRKVFTWMTTTFIKIISDHYSEVKSVVNVSVTRMQLRSSAQRGMMSIFSDSVGFSFSEASIALLNYFTFKLDFSTYLKVKKDQSEGVVLRTEFSKEIFSHIFSLGYWSSNSYLGTRSIRLYKNVDYDLFKKSIDNLYSTIRLIGRDSNELFPYSLAPNQQDYESEYSFLYPAQMNKTAHAMLLLDPSAFIFLKRSFEMMIDFPEDLSRHADITKDLQDAMKAQSQKLNALAASNYIEFRRNSHTTEHYLLSRILDVVQRPANKALIRILIANKENRSENFLIIGDAGFKTMDDSYYYIPIVHVKKIHIPFKEVKNLDFLKRNLEENSTIPFIGSVDSDLFINSVTFDEESLRDYQWRFD